MGKLQTQRRIPSKDHPPAEFAALGPVLQEFQKKLDVLTTSTAESSGKYARAETHAQITQIHHQRNRYLFNVFYKRKAISEDTWKWLVKWKYVDVDLVSKWRKQGYERLCCLDCIGETVCICRVPLAVRKGEHPSPCTKCGCLSCSSGD